MAAIPFLWPVFLTNSANQLPFYQEAAGEELATAPGAKSDTQPQAARKGPSRDSIQEEVRQAVQAVLGAAVADETPLVQAGLDSLGTLFATSRQ